MVVRRRLRDDRPDDPPPVAKFTIGYALQLHSGGPQMTVADDGESIGGKTHLGVRVIWFDQGGVLLNNLVPQDCLKLLVQAPSPNALGATVNETQGEGGYLAAPPEPAP
jgi:uncharacterized protein YodC (DUF2158 family)